MGNSRVKWKLPRLRFLPRLIRSVRKRLIRFLHGDEYFIAEYFGARFLVRSQDLVAREISLQTFERSQIQHMRAVCARLRPDLFIDIGANAGLYSCVLLKQKLVPFAILFEPDQRNFANLSANLLINDLTEVVDCRQAAVSAAPGRLRLVPGKATNTGTSRVAHGTGASQVSVEDQHGYDVEAIRIDDAVALSGRIIAAKIDVEGHELQALLGMSRTLKQNTGVVQIETMATRADVIKFMNAHGYELTADFHAELVFEKS